MSYWAARRFRSASASTISRSADRSGRRRKSWATVKLSSHYNLKTVTRKEEAKKEKANTKVIEDIIRRYSPRRGYYYVRAPVAEIITYKYLKRQVLTVDGEVHYGDWECIRKETERVAIPNKFSGPEAWKC